MVLDQMAQGFGGGVELVGSFDDRLHPSRGQELLMVASFIDRSSRNGMLFLEAGLQILEVYRNAGLRAFGRSSEILDRPRNWLPQLTRCPQWPIRIPQELSGDDDCVRLSGNHDVLGLNG